MPCYRLSDFYIEIDAPNWALDHFDTFLSSGKEPDFSCKVFFGKRPEMPLRREHLVVETFLQSVYDHNGDLEIFSGNGEDEIPQYFLFEKKAGRFTICIDPLYRKLQYAAEWVKAIILLRLRLMLNIILTQHQGVLVHSSSIIWRDAGILFSAHSGTGKTTHTNLWERKYGVPILDGDVTACRILDGNVTAYGLPWCGSSGKFLNRSVPLEAIFFLQQSGKNRVEKLDVTEAFQRLATQCVMPRWGEKLTALSLDTIQVMTEKTACYLLKCLPDEDAVELVKTCLEER